MGESTWLSAWRKSRRGGEGVDHLLPSRAKVRRVKHHAALPYTEIPAFMKELQKAEGTAALALEFLILTAARKSEVIYASWSEVDLKSQIWIVPAERNEGASKTPRPLSAAAMTVLGRAKELKGDYVFAGRTPGRSLLNMAFLMLLGRINRGDITATAFARPSGWAAEQSIFQNEAVEMALAHAIESKTEAAYRRSDLFGKRQGLMAAWGTFAEVKRALPSHGIGRRLDPYNAHRRHPSPIPLSLFQ